jgi:hypothetical protein
MEDVAAVSSDSDQIGTDFVELITTPGITLSDLQTGLEGLEQQAAQLVSRAESLQPPGALRDQQESLVEALQFRVSGLGGLAEAFGAIDETQNAQASGVVLEEQSKRLTTSDVIWDDLVKAGSEAVLRQEGVSGVAVPDSNFVTRGNEELVSARSWALVLQRLTSGTAGAGLRGSSIAGVLALPGRQRLSPDEENTVTASDRLAFQVLVENSGDQQLTQVPVNLVLQVSPEPIRKTQTIDLINPGDTKAVTFRDINIAGSFGTLVTLRASVEPVEGEENTANNIAEYSVIFTLG